MSQLALRDERFTFVVKIQTAKWQRGDGRGAFCAASEKLTRACVKFTRLDIAPSTLSVGRLQNMPVAYALLPSPQCLPAQKG
jgi:predicted ABC-type transport system involved in lysophospholipase L1 biosynthesis ATPase subunit